MGILVIPCILLIVRTDFNAFGVKTQTEILAVVLPVNGSTVGFQCQGSGADIHSQKTESADRLLVHRTQVAKTLKSKFIHTLLTESISTI